jgi:D-apionolactonase
MSESQLRAGPFNLLYQNGFLRYIAQGEVEVVRMIYFALRDENWGTYELFVEDEQIENHDDHFSIRYTGYNRKGNKNIFKWRVWIEGLASGEIKFQVEGEALENVLKNRAGFCVLHPIKKTAGTRCEIIHAGGSVEKSHFPLFISPDNPFKNIRAMNWECTGHWFNLEFEGDIFETEDQRNWTDASFKTFCTPLELPFPVRIMKGEQVVQRVIFTPLEKKSNEPDQSINKASRMENKKAVTRSVIPEIGICASTETDHLSTFAIESLRALRLNYYRIEVTPSQPDWIAKFSADCRNANHLQLPLEIALHVTDNYEAEVNELVKACETTSTLVKKILLLSEGHQATSQVIVNYAKAVKKFFPDSKVGAGTDFNFTELNRNRFDATSLDFISYAIHPQEHAFDDLSIMETIEAQGHTVSSAQNIYPGCEIHISPITLRKRFNPYAHSVIDKIRTNEQKADPRQSENFCAQWTARSLHQFAQCGVSSITYYQTVGKQGVIDENKVYPVYSILKERGE